MPAAIVRPALVLTALLMLLTGALYPAIVTGLAQLAFPAQANGSLVSREGRVVGSALIGQGFTRPEYLHPRPSAAGDGYDGMASSGTNKGPTDAKLADTLVAGAVGRIIAEDGATRGAIPADYATSSGSGLDPHVSPAAALLQVQRIAQARAVDPARVRALIEQRIEQRTVGLLGEPRVNVLLVNLDLDRELPLRGAATTRP
jgi:K+-transporting ATPase ATPase C chain